MLEAKDVSIIADCHKCRAVCKTRREKIESKYTEECCLVSTFTAIYNESINIIMTFNYNLFVIIVVTAEVAKLLETKLSCLTHASVSPYASILVLNRCSSEHLKMVGGEEEH